MKLRFLFVLVLLLFTGGCTKAVVFYNSEPMPFTYNMICPGGNLNATVHFISYKEIKEGKDSAYWPIYHKLETPAMYEERMKDITYQVKVANPKRHKIQIIQKYIKDNRMLTAKIYEGTLPLRNYEFQFQVKDVSRQEMWIEILVPKRNSYCATPHAILVVKNKQRKVTR